MQGTWRTIPYRLFPIHICVIHDCAVPASCPSGLAVASEEEDIHSRGHEHIVAEGMGGISQVAVFQRRLTDHKVAPEIEAQRTLIL